MGGALYPDQLLKRRALRWAVQLKVNPQRIDILELPTKWGSCASDGVVTFAQELAFADEDFQDYVIVHELLHLRYRNHGKRFRAMMTAVVPRWRELEQLSREQSSRRALRSLAQ